MAKNCALYVSKNCAVLLAEKCVLYLTIYIDRRNAYYNIFSPCVQKAKERSPKATALKFTINNMYCLFAPKINYTFEPYALKEARILSNKSAVHNVAEEIGRRRPKN